VKQRIALGVTAVVVAATAPAVAHAAPVVPQPNTPCSATLAGALTRLPDGQTVLQCGDDRWQIFDDPYPRSGRWLSYGPVLTLHGEGQRNREIDSGDWIGSPQEPDSRCSAAQLDVVAAGDRTPPTVSAGEPGKPLHLQLLPLLFTVELSGNCLWQQVR
jgi:hypothetical protein